MWRERLNVFYILGASMWEPESTSKVSGPFCATKRNLEVGVWVNGGSVLAEREAFDADEQLTGVILSVCVRIGEGATCGGREA
jgi:hypothetical protein